jgi:hypothetical protein
MRPHTRPKGRLSATEHLNSYEHDYPLIQTPIIILFYIAVSARRRKKVVAGMMGKKP